MNAPKSGLINSFSPSPAAERIKPPPNAINFENKVVKLGRGSVKVTSQLDSLSIKSQFTKIKQTKSPEAITSTNGSTTSNDTNTSSTSSDAPTVTITKILPQRLINPKPGKKIHLKRPGHFEVPSESSETNTVMDTDTSLSKPEMQETSTGSIDKPESERQMDDVMVRILINNTFDYEHFIKVAMLLFSFMKC